jgi:hypothetical protein
VLPLCVGKRKGGKEGTGEGKGHKRRKSPKTLTGTVRVALPGWLCHPPHCSHVHLTLLSHFTPPTSHFTLHTTTTVPPPPPTRRGPPAAQGQAPLIPGRLPLSPANLRGLRGVVPPAARKGLPWQNANLPTSQVHSDPERGQDAHLPLACLVGQSRFDWYRACSQGVCHPPAAPDLATARFSCSQSTQQ